MVVLYHASPFECQIYILLLGTFSPTYMGYTIWDLCKYLGFNTKAGFQ